MALKVSSHRGVKIYNCSAGKTLPQWLQQHSKQEIKAGSLRYNAGFVMYVCMCMCVHVCIYVCVCVYVCVCMYVCMYMCMCVNADFRKRLELLQDFTFPVASLRIKCSKDGQYIAVAGIMCVYVCVCVVCVCVCVCVYMHVCVCVCVCVCACMCVCVFCCAYV